MEEMNKYEKMVHDAIGTRISRTKAIRLKCLDCCIYQVEEVKACPSKECPLWRYRLGVEINDDLNPKKEMSNQEREQRKEQLKKARASKNRE